MSRHQSNNKPPLRTEIEISVQNDGLCFVSRGTIDQNDVLHNVLDGVVDVDSLNDFLYLANETDLIFGNNYMCG
jgi:hypothetical protein